MGIASIDGLGPRGIGFHTQDEQIEVATLVLKAQALARFLASLARLTRTVPRRERVPMVEAGCARGARCARRGGGES